MNAPNAPADAAAGRAERAGGWRRWGGFALAVAIGVVIGGGAVAAFTSASANSAPPVAPVPAAASVCSATDVANKTLPTVVTISVTAGQSGGTGSGEIIRPDGYVLTNNHVISAAASGGQVGVLFSDGRSAPATITGRDPKADLAVIKVDGQSSLPVIPFGSSKAVVVGQPVVALGAPLGLSNTVTSGIVSALDRTVEVPGDAGQTALPVSALQTDAAINPGNSGGALVDCGGQLVGVPSAGASIPEPGGGGTSGSIGLGFAIPVDLAKSISDEIIATGTVTHSYFGLTAATLPPSVASAAGKPGGIFVTSVVPAGPAAKAGLRAGDIITALDGQQATSTQDLAAITLSKKPGASVTVDYVRGGTPQTTTITLGAQP